MQRPLSIILGGALSVAIMVAGLWAWQSSLRLSATAMRPEIALWAFRSGAVALVAIAQTIMLTFVVGRIYRRELFGGLLRWAATLIGGAALISAVALGLAGL